MWFQSLGQVDPLEKEMATHSRILPGKFHGQRSLAGYSPWGGKELGMTERPSTYAESPEDKGAHRRIFTLLCSMEWPWRKNLRSACWVVLRNEDLGSVGMPGFKASDQIRSDQSLSHVRLFATP